MRDSDWTRILGWPGYRVYLHEVDEKAKTLKLWVRRKRGNQVIICSGCGRGRLHMTDKEFLQAMQSRVARTAVGASTVRGRGMAGTVVAARTFLREMDLRAFGNPSSTRFRSSLDASTHALLDSLPPGASHWGVARKVMNIFLRDCLYTTYLDAAFSLRKNEALLELPLDSITAVHLKRAAGRGNLPAWPGVKHLTAPLSTKFQQAATIEAAKRGIPRVHLDAIWWSVSRDDDAD